MNAESGSELDLDGEADPGFVENLKEVLDRAEAASNRKHSATVCFLCFKI